MGGIDVSETFLVVKDNCPSLEIQEVSLFLLMYADDTVLFTESQEGFQHMFNTLSEYSATWNH